jgi:hypothetical protein
VSTDLRAEKARGLAFARALQNAVRTTSMFGADHPSSIRPLQQSYDVLTPVLKALQNFTVGFVDERVMLNNILTSEPSLKQLENEFLKRGIGAVTFTLGLTFANYRRIISVISTHPDTIEANGGLISFLSRNIIEGARIHPSPKNEKRNAQGDTLLDIDSESYLHQKAARAAPMPNLAGLELLFAAANTKAPENLGGGGPTDILRIVNETVQMTVVEPTADPKKSYNALAQILQDVRPDFVLSAFPKSRRPELTGLPTEQVAAEFLENAAFQWASKRVNDAKAHGQAVMDDELVTVLVRALYATEMSEKVAEKLAYYFKEYALPKTTYDALQDEISWIALPRIEKHARLLKIEDFSQRDYRRLSDHVHDLMKRSEVEAASEVSRHYFKFLDHSPDKISPELLSRAPEIISTMAGVRTFSEPTCERLCRAAANPEFNPFAHFQIVNGLAALGSKAALCEHFDLAANVAEVLHDCYSYDPTSHQKCCGRQLPGLLPGASIERLIEMVLDRRFQTSVSSVASRLVRLGGKQVSERFMNKLEESTDSNQRLTLLRVLSRAGDAALELARGRLKSDKWYVVRNACVLLGELNDPSLLDDVKGLLAHQHERVREAAVNAVLRSSDPRRSRVLASGLHHLSRQLRDKVLWELRFAKDDETVAGIEQFIFRHSYGDGNAARSAVEILAAMDAERALDVLGVVLCDDTFELSLRQFAYTALRKHNSEHSQRILEEFKQLAPMSPALGKAAVGESSS